MKSIAGTNKPKKGRPPVDSTPVNLRLGREMIDTINDFRRAEPDLPSMPEAIRRILDRILVGGLFNASDDTSLDFFFAEVLDRVSSGTLAKEDALGYVNDVVAVLDRQGARPAIMHAKAHLTR